MCSVGQPRGGFKFPLSDFRNLLLEAFLPINPRTLADITGKIIGAVTFCKHSVKNTGCCTKFSAGQ